MEEAESNPDCKRVRLSSHQSIRLSFRCFTQAREYNVPVTGPLLMEQAEVFARELGDETFAASAGFIAAGKIVTVLCRSRLLEKVAWYQRNP